MKQVLLLSILSLCQLLVTKSFAARSFNKSYSVVFSETVPLSPPLSQKAKKPKKLKLHLNPKQAFEVFLGVLMTIGVLLTITAYYPYLVIGANSVFIVVLLLSFCLFFGVFLIIKGLLDL